MDGAPSPLSSPEAQPTLVQVCKPIFWGWEKLRIVYLFVTGGFCLLLLVGSDPTPDEQLRFWMTCLTCGFVANVCYFAGPVVETYAAWLGFRQHTWLRPVLFTLGTLFTLLMAFGILWNVLVPIDVPF